MVDVPAIVRSRAEACGAHQWLAALPQLLDDLAAAWGFVLGDTFAGGTEAMVAAVTLADGTDAVVKVLMPTDDTNHEATVLRLADGRGCVRMLRHDEASNAMLLERLGEPLAMQSLSDDEREQILCTTVQRLWRPAPANGLPTGADKGRWLVDAITTAWTELGAPCSARAVDHAVTFAQRRIAAHDDERAVLVHGDVHQWNVLSADDGSYKLIDPDGLLSEAEYDLGVVLREDSIERMGADPRRAARRLATRTGLDAEAIWEWAVVERISTGLVCERIGLQPVGRKLLAAVDHLAALSER